MVTRAKLNLMKTENFVSSEVFIYKIFVRTLELSELSVYITKIVSNAGQQVQTSSRFTQK